MLAWVGRTVVNGRVAIIPGVAQRTCAAIPWSIDDVMARAAVKTRGGLTVVNFCLTVVTKKPLTACTVVAKWTAGLLWGGAWGNDTLGSSWSAISTRATILTNVRCCCTFINVVITDRSSPAHGTSTVVPSRSVLHSVYYIQYYIHVMSCTCRIEMLLRDHQ